MTVCSEQIQNLQKQIGDARILIQNSDVFKAMEASTGAESLVAKLEQTLRRIESEITEVPQVDVALVGRSRHGKSTLINSLAGAEILKTSNIRPCTATIVRLVKSDDWSIEIDFVTGKRLKEDWRNAVADAEEFLDGTNEDPDNVRYLLDTLERFIELFEIDKSEMSAEELLRAVKEFTVPEKTKKHLGKQATIPGPNLKKVQKTVAKYLSTDGYLWPIVHSCTIYGPLENWHPNLGLVDLPGTNDLNAHRTQITNSVRNSATAVALITSESNLGPDIEAWLRDSQVLSNFLEARDEHRQNLFIVRTQLDSFVPDVEISYDSQSPLSKEEQEERQYQDTMEAYKAQQRDVYHEMLQDIVAPLLHVANPSEKYAEKRKELNSLISKLPVHFVSALAYEVFQGRSVQIPTRKQRDLRQDFNENENLTGIPRLLDFLNEIAAEYLRVNFFKDKSRQIESEVACLAEFFRTEWAALEIAKQSAGSELIAVTSNVRKEVLPWMQKEISTTIRDFTSRGHSGVEGLQHRMEQSWALSERRFQDKIDKWNNYAWNSMRAMGRKGGVHITCNGQYIDVAEDICSVLVDDLLLVWTSYRDHLIEKQVDRVTKEFASELISRIQSARSVIQDREANNAIDQIIKQLSNVANLNRQKLLRTVDQKITELESIRRPAYNSVRTALQPTFDAIANERGAGCQSRMRKLLETAFRKNINGIRRKVDMLIKDSANGLLEHCGTAMASFGTSAASEIDETLQRVERAGREKDLALINGKHEAIDKAVALFPSP